MSEAIYLRRKSMTEQSTIGELYLPDSSFFCFTLEDPVRDHKIADHTAIPAGRYEVIVNWSNRFQRVMPRLLNVPYYQGILIHYGNTVENTSGCLLVGKKKGTNEIYESRLAFDELFLTVKKLTGMGKLFIEIEGGFTADKWKEAKGTV